MPKEQGWIGVDLDGTLAHDNGWKGDDHIGYPIPLMVRRVKKWLDEGRDVRIFTARTKFSDPYIQAWCLKHLGRVLPITSCKDMQMIELWDDRAVSVRTNFGFARRTY